LSSNISVRWRQNFAQTLGHFRAPKKTPVENPPIFGQHDSGLLLLSVLLVIEN